jgi:hypothetical protein
MSGSCWLFTCYFIPSKWCKWIRRNINEVFTFKVILKNFYKQRTVTLQATVLEFIVVLSLQTISKVLTEFGN